MPEVSIGTAMTVMKTGAAVYEFLKQMNDKTVMVNCQFPTDKTDDKIIFTAYDHRLLLMKLISCIPPWGVNTRSCMGTSEVRREDPKAFAVIEVICKNNEEFRRILDKYQGNSAIKQHHVVEYLTIVASRYEKINISMVSTCMGTKRWQGVGPNGMPL